MFAGERRGPRKLRSRCRTRHAMCLLAFTSVGLVGVVSAAEASFPGRNGRIAYLDSRGGISSVWPSGAGEQRLVTRGREPAYSPRGDRIAFTRLFELAFEGGSAFVGRLGVAGLNGRHRTLTHGDDHWPAWAPDGTRTVFARSDPCDKYYNSEADCPPRVQRNKRYGILVRRRGGRTKVLARNGTQPAWSPDGKLITYVHGQRNGSPRLNLIKPDGTRARSLARPRVLGQSPDWSPDGSRIVFASGFAEDASIWVVRRNGTGRHRLARNADRPSYSPDGRWIVFVRVSGFGQRGYRHCDENAGYMLWLIPASGGRPRPLRSHSGVPVCGEGPDWQPRP